MRKKQGADPERARIRWSAALVAELARTRPAKAFDLLAKLSADEWDRFSWTDVPGTSERVKSLWYLELLRREIAADGGKHYREKVIKGSDAYGDLALRLADFDDAARQAFLKHVDAPTVLQVSRSSWQFTGKAGVRGSLMRAYALKLLSKDADKARAELRALPIADLEGVEDAEAGLTKAQAKALADLIRTVRADPTVPMLRTEVRDWPDDIRDLKYQYIDLWKVNATHVEPDSLALAVLKTAITIAALGMGGVAYGILHDMLKVKDNPTLLQEFVMLAGLEAADLTAESYFRGMLGIVERDMKTSVASAADKDAVSKTFTQKAFTALLTASKGDALDTYVAAMKMQAHVEADIAKEKVGRTGASMTYGELLQLKATQKLTHDKLLEHPEGFMRELTVGYVRLLDDAHLSAEKTEHGREADESRRRDTRDFMTRTGVVSLWPAIS